MSLLTETLERIVRYLESGHPIMVGIARSLQPGLSDEEIASSLEDFPYALPNEVIELYRWRNGQIVTSFSDGIAPYHYLLPLDESLENYRNQIKLAKEFSEEDIPWQQMYDPCWLPIFRESSNFYVVPTSSELQAAAPIFYKSEYSVTRDDVWKDEMFPTLTTMMLAIAEWWEEEAYHIAKNICGGDYLSIDIVKRSRIHLKYQPLRQRAVELLLLNQKHELTEEELARAYSDLVAIRHPKAEEILNRGIQFYAGVDERFSDQLKRSLNHLRSQER